MINNEDLLALQSWVTAKDASQYDDFHEDTLVVDITHSNLKQRHIEIRFDRHSTISTVRDKVSSKKCFKKIFRYKELTKIKSLTFASFLYNIIKI